MATETVNRKTKARAAVVGADTPRGERIRAALEERGVPGSRVDLFGPGGGEALLGEYAGEARLMQEPDPGEVARHQVVFLCRRDAVVERIAETAENRSLLFDVDRCTRRGRGFPPVHPALDPQPEAGPGTLLAIPHPLAMALAGLLHPIETAFGVRSAAAWIHRPASDFGKSGLEELREQAVHLLRFDDPPSETFGRQLAFNLIPQRLVPGREGDDLERRVSEEVARILRWPEARLAVRVTVAPIFRAHTLGVRVIPARKAGEDQMRGALARAPWAELCDPSVASTPIEAPEGRALAISEVAPDGTGGFWIWLVAAELEEAAAEETVRLAERLAGL